MAQKTAVEWLEEKMKKLTPPGYQTEISAMLENAKQMEKEQLDKAYYKGQESKYIGGPSYCEQYYNETFGK